MSIYFINIEYDKFSKNPAEYYLILKKKKTKIGLTSINVVARRFLMSHGQVPRKWLPRSITW